MAIYHLSVKVIGRARGQSAIAAAAYRSGERLIDEATGQVKHYPARAERIRFTGIFAPLGSPSWVRDRNRLWNEAERIEKRKDATLAREIVLALPHELTDQQRQWLVSDYVRETFVRRGLVADVAIHAPDRHSDSRNFHAHILITERTIKGVGKPSKEIRAPETASEIPPGMQGDSVPVDPGFSAKKDRSLYSKETLYGWRASWSRTCNRCLVRHGHLAARIDHRTLAEQKIDREPTRHLGMASAQKMRRGVSTVRGDGLKATRVRNALRAVTGAAREIAWIGHGGARAAVEWPLAQRLACLPSIPPIPTSAPQRREEASFKGMGKEIGDVSSARLPPELHVDDAGDERPHEPCSLEAEVMEITARCARGIEAARKSGRSRFEIEATIRALREQQRAEIIGAQERRKMQTSSRSFTTVTVL